MSQNGNLSMEEGTPVVAQKSRTKYYVGFGAMLLAIGAVIALVVVFTGSSDGTTEELVSTTEGPTPVTTTVTIPTVAPPPVTTAAPTPAPLEEIGLDDVINGLFTPTSFNGSWVSGDNVLFRNSNGDLVVYDFVDESSNILIANTSQSLQSSSRVQELSADETQIVLAVNVGSNFRHSFFARYVILDLVSGNETEVTPVNLVDPEPYLQKFIWSSSGTAFAFVYRNNIYYQDNISAEQRQLTSNGVLDVVYNGIPDWVYEEEVFGPADAIWFSSSGERIAYATFDDRNVRVMRVPYYGLGFVEYQYTAHREIHYPKAGTVNPTVIITMVDLLSGTTTGYQAPVDLEQPILKTAQFINNNTVAVMWTDRVQSTLRVVLCTQAVQPCNTIYSYTESGGWIGSAPMIFNQAGNAFITILPQAVNGVLYKQVVRVSQSGSTWTSARVSNISHTVIEILKWTDDDIIWYSATHQDDSAQQHVYTINAAGSTSCFTCDIRRPDNGACLFNDASLSTSGSRILINCAGPGVPQLYAYDSNGSLIRVWDSNAETFGLVDRFEVPEIIRLSVPIVAGLPEADVLIQVPANYQSRTNVPLLVYVYGGPDSAAVTHQWGVDWGSSLVSRYGIAVAKIDGRGSNLKNVQNLFSINRGLGTLEIDDQINVTRYLQDNLPWVDANRTCIWGWSYGGYAASMGLARGGDVFRCALAVAPVVDWRYYDTIYTERYMDVPQNNSIGYTASSLLTDEVVDSYRNKSYFLIHGTADDNVHYQHAMLFSRLLQRRDVYFTQMSYTDGAHSLDGVKPHLYHALEKFLRDYMF